MHNGHRQEIYGSSSCFRDVHVLDKQPSLYHVDFHGISWWMVMLTNAQSLYCSSKHPPPQEVKVGAEKLVVGQRR